MFEEPVKCVLTVEALLPGGSADNLVVRVTPESITNGILNKPFTKDPYGLAYCSQCRFSVGSHRREKTKKAVDAPALLPAPPTMTIERIRKLAGDKNMPDNYAKTLLAMFQVPGVNHEGDIDIIIRKHYMFLRTGANTRTCQCFIEEADISLSDPLKGAGVGHEKERRIMMGMHRTSGDIHVVKFVLTSASRPTLTSNPQDYDRHLYDGYMELKVARLSPSCAALVPCSIASFSQNMPYFYPTYSKAGIVMPHYPRTAATFSPVNDDTLADLIRPIGDAVIFLHGKNIIHMDIKPANIFIDDQGKWFLGDYGSACDEDNTIDNSSDKNKDKSDLNVNNDGDNDEDGSMTGAKRFTRIRATTNLFHLTTTKLNTTATPQHDWGMLLCTLAFLMNVGEPTTTCDDPNVGIFAGHFLPAARTKIFSRATGKLAALIADWTVLAGDM